MKCILTTLLFFCFVFSWGQDTTKTSSDTLKEPIFEMVDELPEFPGGEAAMMRFIMTNLNYPAMARENGIQGSVYIEFTVKKDGSISDIKIIKNVHDSLSREAIRVVKKFPRWKPGKQNGVPVNVRYRLPIKFKLA